MEINNFSTIKNKKGDEKLLSIWWFVCLVVVGVTITVVITVYLSTPIDTRFQETEILQEKIFDCVIQNGFLENEILEKNPNQFLDFCKLHKKTINESNKYFFYLEIIDSSENQMKNFSAGDVNFKQHCATRLTGRNMPVCKETSLVILYFNENTIETEKIKINILTASNNLGKRIPITK